MIGKHSVTFKAHLSHAHCSISRPEEDEEEFIVEREPSATFWLRIRLTNLRLIYINNNKIIFKNVKKKVD